MPAEWFLVLSLLIPPVSWELLRKLSCSSGYKASSPRAPADHCEGMEGTQEPTKLTWAGRQGPLSKGQQMFGSLSSSTLAAGHRSAVSASQLLRDLEGRGLALFA